MSEQRITVSKEQLESWPERIQVDLLLPRDLYKVLWEVAVNHQPQISVVEVIMDWLQYDAEEA